jgi:hypothetical protein
MKVSSFVHDNELDEAQWTDNLAVKQRQQYHAQGQGTYPNTSQHRGIVDYSISSVTLYHVQY